MTDTPNTSQAEDLVPSIEVTVAMLGKVKPLLVPVLIVYAQAALDSYISVIRPAVSLALQQRDEKIAELEAPIDMILFCPACGVQHVDGIESALAWTGGSVPEPSHDEITWENPPHRSHLCHGCGHIWRPADRATNGVKAIATIGKADSPASDPRARILALEGEIARLRDWHPIETAPKDGSFIDLWMGNDILPFRRDNHRWAEPDHTCGEAGQYCDSCPPEGHHWCDEMENWLDPQDNGEPTHWRLSPPEGPTLPHPDDSALMEGGTV